MKLPALVTAATSAADVCALAGIDPEDYLGHGNGYVSVTTRDRFGFSEPEPAEKPKPKRKRKPKAPKTVTEAPQAHRTAPSEDEGGAEGN